MSDAAPPGPPLWLLAELTYRCPLHCAFCYNPVDFATQGEEMGTEDWLRVLSEARALGAVQCGFSGGEPLVRNDLEGAFAATGLEPEVLAFIDIALAQRWLAGDEPS